MRDTIKLIVEVYQKATIIVSDQTPSSSGKCKWRIKYPDTTASEWKNSGTSISVDSDAYEIELNDIDGYNKPNNYIFHIKAGETKQIKVIYTQKKSSQLEIYFTIKQELQKYLSWRLIQLEDRIITDWNHDTSYIENLPNGNYQLQINSHTSNIVQPIDFYDYLTGESVTNNFVIEEQNIDIILNQNRQLSYNISGLPANIANVCVTITPEKIENLVEWRLSTPTVTGYRFKSGDIVSVPYGTYIIETTPVTGWYLKNSEPITIASNNETILIGFRGEIYGNLRVKINPPAVKDLAKWKPVGTSVWYMDNEEISLFPNSYEIEFLPINNYAIPDNQNYYVGEDQVTIKTMEYVFLGSLQINITSNLLLESLDTPQWRIKNNVSWKNSGDILYLVEGDYIVEFNNVGNIFTHEDITVTITNDTSTIEEIEFVGISIIAIPTKNNVSFYNFNNFTSLSVLSALLSFQGTNQVAFNHNDTLIAIAHNNTPYLTIYDLIDYNIYFDASLTLPLGGCRSLDFSKDGKYLSISHNNFPYLTIYNTNDWTTITLSYLPSGYCNTVKFSHDSNYLAIGFEQSPYLLIYNTSDFSIIDYDFDLNSEVFSCKFDTTNRFISVGLNNDFKVFDILDSFNIITFDMSEINGTIYGVEFFNNYIIVISSLFFYIYHYNVSESLITDYELDTKIPIPVPNINNYVDISPNQDYLLIGCTNYPYVIIYKTTNWTRVSFTNSLLTYCKKFAISGDLSLREYVNTPINTYPINEYRGLREFETLEGSEFTCFSLTYNISGTDIGLDTHTKSQWRLFNTDMEIVYDSGECDDLITHFLPESFFDEPTNYFWQVRYKGENFGWSFWSVPTSFVTLFSYVDKPVNLTPLNEELDVDEQPVLTASIFTTVNASDAHVYSEWKIFTIENDQNIFRYTSGAITDLTSHVVPIGILLGKTETTYAWQVRYKAEVLEWSDWSDLTTFVTGIWSIVNPINVIPISQETDINEENVTLISSMFATLNTEDTHTHTRYEIYDSNNSLIYISGEISDTNILTDIEFIVPTGILSDGLKTYYWRVSYKGNKLGWSEWSTATTFTTRALQVSVVYVSIQPTDVLPGKTLPLRWKWKKSSSTLFSSLISSNISTEIPAGQTIIIDFEDYTGLMKPSPITVSLEAEIVYSYNITYGMLFGAMQCNISGNDSGRWRIKGTSNWRDSGYIESMLPYGIYEIEFETITGYITPTNISNIILSDNNLIVKTATYVIDDTQTYYVSVIVDKGRWKLLSSDSWVAQEGETLADAWNNSGSRVSLFGLSSDAIIFDDVENYTSPSSISFLIPDTYVDDETVRHPTLSKTFLYERKYIENNKGSFNCTLTPSYAKWRVLVDNVWSQYYNSNTTIELTNGTYTIGFETIGGYEAIDNDDVLINANLTTTLNHYYILQQDIGHLKVSTIIQNSGWRVKNTDVWNVSDALIDLKVGNYNLEFLPVVGYITPSDLIITITKDKLTNITQLYQPLGDKYIQIIVNGVDYKSVNLKYRVNFSTDSLSWSNQTDWKQYYVNDNDVTQLNDKISNPAVGFYKIEFNPISGYIPDRADKIVEYKNQNKTVYFDFNNDVHANYKGIILTVDIIDSQQMPIEDSNFLNLLEFKYAIVNDTIIRNNDFKSINWSSTWIKYGDFSTTFNSLTKTNKYAFKTKPIDNYFNIGDFGNISYSIFNNTTDVFELKLKYMMYNFTDMYFEIPFVNVSKTNRGLENYQYHDINDFTINYRTKNEFFDIYGDSKSILINGHVVIHVIGGVNVSVFRSNKINIETLFGSKQLGYISTENINIKIDEFNRIMYPYNAKMLIGLGGYNIPAYFDYLG